MQSTMEALIEGFDFDIDTTTFSFKFGDNKEYELCFEPLIFEGQMYVALYKDQSLLTNKVVVKPGKMQ